MKKSTDFHVRISDDELELIDDRFKELSTTSNDAKMTLVKAKPEKKATVKKR